MNFKQMEGGNIEKPAEIKAEKERKCFFCKKEIDFPVEIYSKEWIHGKEVIMHNTCRFDKWDEYKEREANKAA